MLSRRWAVLLLLAPASLRGQDAPILTELDFLAQVTANHPALRGSAGERELAIAETVRAALLPNPEVEATVEAPDGAPRETVAGISWAPPIDGRRALRKAAAEKGLAAAESRLEAARLRLRLDLRAAYAGWAVAWERRELLGAHRERVSDLAEKARARAQAGEIPGLAARRFSLEEAQALADLGRAEARLATARSALAAWAPEAPPDARPAPVPLPSPAGPVADSARPELAAREREVEHAEALRQLSGRRLEAPRLGLGWKRIEDRSLDLSGPVFSAGWTVPLFDRRQADRREAEARLSTARADLELARLRARAERDGALAAYERLRAEAAGADKAAEGTGDLLSGASAAYQLGELGLTDLLDTLRATLAARMTALDVREAALAVQRDLESALGRPLSGDLP